MSFYKSFSEHDRVVSSRPLYEPVELVSGSGGWLTNSSEPYNFVQFASGGSVFNDPDSIHYFDVTNGFYTSSLSSATDQQKAQYTVYNQFAKMLLGHDVNSNIKQFTAAEGAGLTTTPSYLPYYYVINLARSETKDRIEYGTLNIQLIVSGNTSTGATGSIVITDSGSIINAGAEGHHYGILQATPSTPGLLATTAATSSVGYVFYEAGVVVLSPYVFALNSLNQYITGSSVMNNACGILASDKASYATALSTILNQPTSSILDYTNFIKSKLHSISFQSVTELNSTIYFCRAFNHEFNYSSNPTYLKDGEIIVKAGDPEEPSRTYITTVGLYGDDNQLLAVAKLSEPILKTRDNELIARVRIDW